MNRLIVTFAAGVLAYMVALDLGLPAWRHMPGDAADFGVVTAIVVWYAMKELRRDSDTRPKAGDAKQGSTRE